MIASTVRCVGENMDVRMVSGLAFYIGVLECECIVCNLQFPKSFTTSANESLNCLPQLIQRNVSAG
jgi:hypothetical protein